MMDSIAAAATDLSALRLSLDSTFSVTKAVMDTQELAGQELLQMIEAVVPPVKGEYIDTYA